MSVLIALSAVNWIAVNADTFANMILTNFKWWPLPVWLTGIIVVAIWAQSAIRGVKGLEVVSWLGAPAAVIATGGLAGCVTPFCRREIRYEPDLLLIGLAVLWEKNRSGKKA